MSKKETGAIQELRQMLLLQDSLIETAAKVRDDDDHYEKAKKRLTCQIDALSARLADLEHNREDHADIIAIAERRKTEIRREIVMELRKSEIAQLLKLKDKIAACEAVDDE